MKYTKEYLEDNPTVVFVGNDKSIIAKVKAINRHDYTDSCVYGDTHCINLIDSCHCSKDWYIKEGYKIISIEEFLADRGLLDYEIY